MRKICLSLISAFAALASAVAAEDDRASFKGVVTLMRGCDDYFFMRSEAGENWRVSMDGKPKKRFSPGDIVEVSGNLERRQNRHATRIFEADAVLVGHDDGAVPAPRRMTIDGLYAVPEGKLLPSPNWYATPVEVEAVLHDFWRRDETTTIVLQENHRYISCQVSVHLDTPMPEYFDIGARVRVKGVASYVAVWDSKHNLAGFDNVCILSQGVGSIEVVSRPPWWTPARIWTALGLSVAALALLSVWTASLLRANRAKRTALAEAELSRRERLRLSADLHDNFQQLLAGTMCRVKAAQNWFDDDPALARRQIDSAQTSLEHAQDALRAALWGLTEESEGPRGFVALLNYAISRMAHWEGIVTLSASGREPLWARRRAPAMLMVLQEAVGNAISHGAAANVRVRVRFAADALAVLISDDGCGFDTSVKFGSDHLGLAGMKKRVSEMGGRFRVLSKRGAGTRVWAGIVKGTDDDKALDS